MSWEKNKHLEVIHGGKTRNSTMETGIGGKIKKLIYAHEID